MKCTLFTGPNEFNWLEKRTFQSLPANAWNTENEEQWRGEDGQQYRSINAVHSNPAKSPLSSRAFFSPSVVRRQLAPLSRPKPKSSFVALRDTETPTTDADWGSTRKEGTVYRMSARKIDRMSSRPRPNVLQLVASKNIDNVETIKDVHERSVGLKHSGSNEDSEKELPNASQQTRRISRRKLEHYDNSGAQIAPVEKGARKEGSSLLTTISTHQKDKQANDVESESNSDRDAALATESPEKKATKTKYANEGAPENKRLDTDSDGKDNPDKGEQSEEGTAGKKAASSNLASNGRPRGEENETVSKYVGEQSGAKTTATVTLEQPESNASKYAVVSVRGAEAATDDNLNGNDGADSLESGHEPKEEEELSEKEANQSRINHYSTLAPSISSQNEHQNGSSLVSKVSRIFFVLSVVFRILNKIISMRRS